MRTNILGAEVSDTEQLVLVNYLTKTYGKII